MYTIRFSSLNSIMDFYRKAQNSHLSFSLRDQTGTGLCVTENNFERIFDLDLRGPLDLTISSGDAAGIFE